MLFSHKITRMPYLIDGHNLIGKLPDIHLDQADDEERLIERLAAFCRTARKQVEVYFDQAAPGQAGRFRHGPVTAVFISAGGTADAAIARRVQGLGRAAQNWTVVSSDNAVQASARAGRARVMPSEQFAGLLRSGPSGSGSTRDTKLGEDELAEWLRIFGEGPDD